MATKESMAIMELMLNLISGKTEGLSKVNYEPQKPSMKNIEASGRYFLRATPESQGIASQHLERLFSELASQKETDIHHVMVMRNGYVIGECHYAPYQADDWHISHSMCKSLTGMAIGLLIGEEKLSLKDKVVNIFGKRKNILNLLRMKDMTIEHLLTMTSRVSFNETGAVTSNDWVKSFLESSVHGAPGSEFEYNSMNTYMLSAILTEITGETLLEYLKPRLFEPLGIHRVFWESCPKGITKGGWGLYICPEDALKLGQLYLQKGFWEGKAIISEEWVEISTVKHVDTPEHTGSHGYGYQIWICGRPGSFIYNGMLGQNVMVYPDLNMIVLTNAASREIFRDQTMSDTLKRYFEDNFSPPAYLPENVEDYQKLCAAVRAFEKGRKEFPLIQKGGWGERRSRAIFIPSKEIAYLDGKCFVFEKKHIGLMPLIMQVFHNNYTSGISQMSFSKRKDGFYWIVQEGESRQCLKIGFVTAERGEIEEHGEPYCVAVKGEFASDEDGNMVLKLDIAFLEDAARRRVKLHFEKERNSVIAKWDEVPGKELIEEGMESLISDGSNILLDFLKEKGGVELCTILVERTVCPFIEGKIKNETSLIEEKSS